MNSRAEARVYSNDQVALDALPELSEEALTEAREVCDSQDCKLECLAGEVDARLDSRKFVAIFVCGRSIDSDDCLTVARTAVKVFDEKSDAVEGIDATMTVSSLYQGETGDMEIVDWYPPDEV